MKTFLDVISDWVLRKYYSFQDVLFESWHGIETGGVIENSKLVSEQSELLQHATAYQAVWGRNLQTLIDVTQKIAKPDLFIDIGSGKGKACFFASKHFSRVLGVEFSRPLVDVAEKNKISFKRKNIEFVVGDAGQYDLPDYQSLIFLFNPFDHIQLTRFIQRNMETIHKKNCFIAYANDKERQVFVQLGFDCVFRDPSRKLSLWKTFCFTVFGYFPICKMVEVIDSHPIYGNLFF